MKNFLLGMFVAVIIGFGFFMFSGAVEFNASLTIQKASMHSSIQASSIR